MPETALKILAIDTATEGCSAALNLGGAITQRFQAAPNQHSRLLPAMLDELLQSAGLELAALDALAVDVGPGAFTGVRIGIGIAQGLAYAAGLPVIGVTSLEALAHGVAGEAAEVPAAAVLPALDARMGQVYYGVYRGKAQIRAPALAAPESVCAAGESEIIAVGGGWARYAAEMRAALKGVAVLKEVAGRYPDAACVSEIAAARGLAAAVSPLELCAAYIRDEVARPALSKDAPESRR